MQKIHFQDVCPCLIFAWIQHYKTSEWRYKMTESQNVQIPLSLFRKILHFFTLCSLSDHNFPELYEFNTIISDLREKQDKINVRETYTKAVYARNDKERNHARSVYTKLKNMH
jgi:hypothetical protein